MFGSNVWSYFYLPPCLFHENDFPYRHPQFSTSLSLLCLLLPLPPPIPFPPDVPLQPSPSPATPSPSTPLAPSLNPATSSGNSSSPSLNPPTSSGNSSSPSVPSLTTTPTPAAVATTNPSPSSSGFSDLMSEPLSQPSLTASSPLVAPPPSTGVLTRSRTGVLPPHRFNISRDPRAYAVITGLSESTCFSQAKSDPNWLHAMAEEYQVLIDNGTWILVFPPPRHNIIGCNWVFKLKWHSDGSIDRYKA